MNLIDVLLFQDRRELVNLLNDSNCHYNRNSKRELIEILYPKLLNSDDLFLRFQQLSNYSKQLTLSLCYDKKLFLSRQELNGFIKSVNQHNLSTYLNELRTAGILFKYAGENFLIPEQIKKEISNRLKSALNEQSIFLPSRSNENPKEMFIINDIISFIDTISERQLPLTKSGMLHKKDFQLIMKQFNVQEMLPTEKWRFGYGRRFSQYPDRFSLIYDFCFNKSWIKEDNGYLKLGMAVEQLNDLKIADLIKEIVLFWQNTYRRAVPTISTLFNLFIDALIDGEGIEEEVIVDQFLPYIEQYYFDSKENIILKRFLTMLDYLNIVKKVQIESVNCYTIGPSINYYKK